MKVAKGETVPSSDVPTPLTLAHLTVYASRMEAEVHFAPDAPRTSTPELISQLEQDFPHLGAHACVNARGSQFADVMEHTSLAHVLEHLVIDLQVQAHRTPDTSDREATFVGTTEWVDKAAGIARVRVSFADDLVALAAFRQATEILNKLLVRI